MRINGPALTAIRERSAVSRQWLADAVGIDLSMVSLIERGQRNASPEVTMRIACALKVELPAILTDPNEFSASGASPPAPDADQSSMAGVGPVRPHPAPAVGAAKAGAS